LIDTHSQEAEGYYNRRISARHSLGVTYRFQQFTFSPLANDTTTHSLLATYAFHPGLNMTLSLFAGPEFVETTGQQTSAAIALPQIQMAAVSVGHQFWKESGGAAYVWNGRRTGLTASVVRKVNDGGGLLGAVNFTNANVAFRQQLSRWLTMGLGWDYGISDAIGAVITPYSSLKSMTGSASVTRLLRNNVGFTLGYIREFQSQDDRGRAMPNINRDRAWVSVFYQFSRPLGR
jgi:hypothetical protein